MAKSLRSKWRRKMKAIKRERYGKKELEKLKLVLEGSRKDSTNCIDVSQLQELVNVVPRPEKSNAKCDDSEDVDGSRQEMDVDHNVKVYDPVTLQDQHGNFPAWMGSHKKKKLIKQQRKVNKIKKKKLKCNRRNK